MPAEPVLDIRDLSVELSIGGRWIQALDRVGLTIQRGEVLGLVGESGSGKSLTALSIAGLLPANARVTGGAIRLMGEDVLGKSEAELNRLRARSVALTGWLESLLEARLGGRIEILTPRDPEARGAQLSVRLSGTRGGGRALFDRLLAGGLTCDWREPDVIRLAPAPMYNSYVDCWRAVEMVDRAINA